MSDKNQKNEHDTGEIVFRQDFMLLNKSGVERTHQGFLRIPATLTKAGVLTYKDHSTGETVNELRHPDDVFDSESMRSMGGAILVSNEHVPRVDITNYKNVQTGFISDILTRNGDNLDGTVVVQDLQTISRIDSGELAELSPGYYCQIIKESGVYNGKPYTQRQKRIRYNHEALGKKGWGRNGPDVALRLDGIMYDIQTQKMTEDGSKNNERRKTVKTSVRLDGSMYTIDVDEAIAPLFTEALRKESQAKDKMAADLGTLTAKLAETEQKMTELQTRFDSAVSPEAIAKLAAERSEVIEVASKVLPETIKNAQGQDVKGSARFDSLSTDGIKQMALYAANIPIAGYEKDASFISGAFSGLKAQIAAAEKKEDTNTGSGYPQFFAARNDSQKDAFPSYVFPSPAPVPPVQQRQDSKEEENTPEAARARMIKRNNTAWKNTTEEERK